MMPKLAAGVLQIPCSGLARFLHDPKSTSSLMLKIASCTCKPFGVKTWCDQRCQRLNVIHVGRSAHIACIATRVRSASMMHVLLHLQLLQSLLVLLCWRMLLLNLQATLLYPLRTQVFGVFTASVNTLTNQGTIDIWDYSYAPANLNSSFAYAKPKGNNDTNDNDLVPLGARANAIKFIAKTSSKNLKGGRKKLRGGAKTGRAAAKT